VVSYLRLLHEPARLRFYPTRPPAELFPLLTLDQLRAAGPQQMQTLATEIGREAATLVMLAAIALAVARNAGEWAAAFVVAFGVWDVTFYLFLKLLLDWPSSLLTWDILFLFPVPWVGPVLAPVMVSLAMIVAGVWHLRREARGGLAAGSSEAAAAGKLRLKNAQCERAFPSAIKRLQRIECAFSSNSLPVSSWRRDGGVRPALRRRNRGGDRSGRSGEFVFVFVIRAPRRRASPVEEGSTQGVVDRPGS